MLWQETHIGPDHFDHLEWVHGETSWMSFDFRYTEHCLWFSEDGKEAHATARGPVLGDLGSIEYEASSMFDLQNVVISVPLPALREASSVRQIDGEWR
ncbi:hypothetical protein L1987_58250 [Smallanthus sonchifolius]|uniref:Uncharacterized protein n=1 Tax=Smallanthus sonchifolius TaxID=185202 RepID=A0ACB9DFB0_9ASTR|nr:hypothetical protein L1987_58250 [Smallanthus sonchifolius]